MTSKIDLISPIAQLRVILEPPDEVVDARFGKRRVDPGKTIRFDRGRASIPADWLPLLKEHYVYTGIDGQKLVWLANEDAPLGTFSGDPQISVGMATARTAGALKPPVDGWDAMKVAEIKKALDQKRVSNLEAALQYELANSRRRMVVRDITDRMLGDKVVEDEDIAEQFTAPAPSEKAA